MTTQTTAPNALPVRPRRHGLALEWCKSSSRGSVREPDVDVRGAADRPELVREGLDVGVARCGGRLHVGVVVGDSVESGVRTVELTNGSRNRPPAPTASGLRLQSAGTSRSTVVPRATVTA